VADKLGVDLILPDSATKPALKGGLRFLPQLGTSGRLYTGPAVLGIKEISRHWSLDRVIRWSSTLRKIAFNLQIMPRAIEQIRKVRKAWDEGDYDALLELWANRPTLPHLRMRIRALILNRWRVAQVTSPKSGNRLKQCFWPIGSGNQHQVPTCRTRSTANWPAGHFAFALVEVFGCRHLHWQMTAS